VGLDLILLPRYCCALLGLPGKILQVEINPVATFKIDRQKRGIENRTLMLKTRYKDNKGLYMILKA
jgi:hypothetical protein